MASVLKAAQDMVTYLTSKLNQAYHGNNKKTFI